MSTLERAIQIAAEAHRGQVDKAGEPYILHPLEVMRMMYDDRTRIVAVLHDVVEDCPEWSFDRLADEGFSLEIIEDLRALTKREGEDYDAYLRRVAGRYVSFTVKIGDISHNSAPERGTSIELQNKYRARQVALAGFRSEAVLTDVRKEEPPHLTCSPAR